MSDPHAAAHDDHAPEPSEFTHPLLWTVGLVAMAAFLVWMFFHEMSVGGALARSEPKAIDLMKAEGGGEPEPDHAALVNERSPDVIDRGRMVYASNCATCHGPNGDLKGGQNPNARNFHTDAFKNDCGGGPYALYKVVTNGFGGGMPAMRATIPKPEDRYAVVHFIRETWIKTDNPQNYLEQDRPEVAASMPKAGEAGTEGPPVVPTEVAPPRTLHPLLHAEAEDADAQIVAQAAWLDAAAGAAAPDSRADFARLRDLARRDRGLGSALQAASRAGDRQRFVDLLVGGQSPGAQTCEFALMGADRLAALYAAAHAAAEGSP